MARCSAAVPAISAPIISPMKTLAQYLEKRPKTIVSFTYFDLNL
jgi:hypothetical protein